MGFRNDSRSKIVRWLDVFPIFSTSSMLVALKCVFEAVSLLQHGVAVAFLRAVALDEFEAMRIQKIDHFARKTRFHGNRRFSCVRMNP